MPAKTRLMIGATIWSQTCASALPPTRNAEPIERAGISDASEIYGIEKAKNSNDLTGSIGCVLCFAASRKWMSQAG